MRWHPASAKANDYMPGACFDDTFGIGQATQAATTAASTAAQIAMEKSAMDKAAKTGAGQAQAISASGETAQNYLNPYVAEGQNMLSNIDNNMSLWGNINNSYTDAANSNVDTASSSLKNLLTNGITQQSIENTPGWSAINNLGQQAVTNSAAARGLANSGAAEKGAADYATTMADQTYQNLYNDQLSTNSNLLNAANGYIAVNDANQGNITNTWNRENQLLGYGANAASAAASNATNTASLSAQAALAGTGATMSGTTSMANSLTNGLNSLGNQASNYGTNYLAYKNLLNGESF